jgi:hypothetical protein
MNPKLRRWLLIIGLLLMVLSGTLLTRPPEIYPIYPKKIVTQYITSSIYEEYTVTPGDSLYSLAMSFKTDPDTLMSINHLQTDIIFPGQQLLIPIQSPIGSIEAEWPAKMTIHKSDTIRISLVLSATQSYTPTIEVPNHTIFVGTPIAVESTPGVSIKNAYGPFYDSCATTNLLGAAFSFNPSESNCRPLTENTNVWDWSIIPNFDGQQNIISNITIRWTSKWNDKQIIEQEIWRYRFNISVSTPFIRLGQIEISEIIVLIIGAVIVAISRLPSKLLGIIKNKFNRKPQEKPQEKPESNNN